MIDFHNHILPGVDDGAKTMQESIEMLKYAESQGITDVVNTVHFQHPRMLDKNTNFKYISSVKNDLIQELDKNQIKINIHLGAEVFFNFNLLEISDNPIVTFCNGNYMLIEFQPLMFPKGFEKHLYDLKLSGVTPIIAHPERYKPIQENYKILEGLINSGCLMQVDAGSILGHFGKKCKYVSEQIIRKNMVHIIGSDAHGSGRRNFCLKEVIDLLTKKINSDTLDVMIASNPKKVILGQEIVPFPIKDSDTFSNRFFSFFKK